MLFVFGDAVSVCVSPQKRGAHTSAPVYRLNQPMGSPLTSPRPFTWLCPLRVFLECVKYCMRMRRSKRATRRQILAFDYACVPNE